MKNLHSIQKEETGLLLIDLQEKLLNIIPESENLLSNITFLIKGCSLFKLPLILSEQYPHGLGKFSKSLTSIIYDELRLTPPCFSKTSFSCFEDLNLKSSICDLPCKTWILAGIETHICLFQTAKDLIDLGKQVIIPRCTTASRRKSDNISALEELRMIGARVTTTETILFEMLKNKESPEFKDISGLVKEYSN